MITSLGAGSGIDIDGLVTRLVAAERAPAQLRLDRREAELQAQLSALGSFRSSLASFRTAIAGLTAASVFQGFSAQSSDPKVVAATARGGAGAGNHEVEVIRLASAHGLAAAPVASTAEPLGTGVLRFRLGTTSHDPETGQYSGFTPNAGAATGTVIIDASNNSLAGIRDAVNRADIGVRASIVKDGEGHRLVFAATGTGAANSLEIRVDDADGDSTDNQGLSRLAFNADAVNLTQTRAAANAELTIDGLAISSASNRLQGVIEGLDLELAGVGSATLTVAADRSAATKAIDDFIRGYNNVIDTIGTLTAVDPATGRGSVLTGDSTLRGAASQLHALTLGVVPGLDGKYRSLADIGIGTDPATGKLVKDEARFNRALDQGFADMGTLFGNVGSSSDALVRYVGAGKDTAIGDHAVEVTRIATRGELRGAPLEVPVVVTAGVNDRLTLTIDGVSTGEIRLAAGTYDGASLAAELQAQINAASALTARGIAAQVQFEDGRLSIVSARYGSASTVAASGSAVAALGLDAGQGTAGVDVAGTIGGQPATGNGQLLTGTGQAAGLVLEISGGQTGARGSVTFTRGISDRLNGFVDQLIGSGDVLASRARGLEQRIDAIGDQRIQLDRRMAGVEARLRAQFIAMDTLVSKLLGTSSFLTQQLANLPGANRER